MMAAGNKSDDYIYNHHVCIHLIIIITNIVTTIIYHSYDGMSPLIMQHSKRFLYMVPHKENDET